MTNEGLATQGAMSLRLSGPRLLVVVEPPSADPHVRWCGVGAQKRATLLDLSTDFRGGINGLFAEIVNVMANEANRFSWIKQ